MTSQHGRHGFRLFPIWVAVLGLVLGFPLLALASGYGHGDAHHATGKTSPHGGAGAMGHGKGYPGGSIHSGHGSKGSMSGRSHGPHQSASKFIDHILKFKDGMAITEDQVAKLQSIKTDFEKTKIRMKADIALTSVDLHDLLRDDKGTLNEVEAKLKNLYDKRADLYLASVKSTRDAKAVLTDEQRARMKTVHDRINAYQGAGMGTTGHPGGYKHHGKEHKS
jgi:Spy/CpxP family protein refolding chaperone